MLCDDSQTRSQVGVLLYGHMVIKTDERAAVQNPRSFFIGIVSKHEVRVRFMLNSMRSISPSFNKRSEVRLKE